MTDGENKFFYGENIIYLLSIIILTLLIHSSNDAHIYSILGGYGWRIDCWIYFA